MHYAIVIVLERNKTLIFVNIFFSLVFVGLIKKKYFSSSKKMSAAEMSDCDLDEV